MDATVRRIEQVTRKHPDEFSGVRIEGDRIFVYRLAPSPLDEEIKRAAAGATVVFKQAPHAARELAELRDRIVEDSAYWHERGITIAAVSASPDGTAVDVHSPQARRAQRLLHERYGADAPLRVGAGGPITLVDTAVPAS